MESNISLWSSKEGKKGCFKKPSLSSMLSQRLPQNVFASSLILIVSCDRKFRQLLSSFLRFIEAIQSKIWFMNILSVYAWSAWTYKLCVQLRARRGRKAKGLHIFVFIPSLHSGPGGNHANLNSRILYRKIASQIVCELHNVKLLDQG